MVRNIKNNCLVFIFSNLDINLIKDAQPDAELMWGVSYKITVTDAPEPFPKRYVVRKLLLLR